MPDDKEGEPTRDDAVVVELWEIARFTGINASDCSCAPCELDDDGDARSDHR